MVYAICVRVMHSARSYVGNSLGLPHYPDKYKPSILAQLTLQRKDLNVSHFPLEKFEGYLNPKKKLKGMF